MRKPPFHSKPFRPPPWRPYLSDHRGIADMQQGLLPQCFAAETLFYCVATVETLEVLVPSSHTICATQHPSSSCRSDERVFVSERTTSNSCETRIDGDLGVEVPKGTSWQPSLVYEMVRGFIATTIIGNYTLCLDQKYSIRRFSCDCLL